jgi:hypothetical protein
VLDDANFAQRWFSPTFGDRGPLAGKTVEEVANALRSGVVKPSDLEVHYIVRDGNTLILNTRTSQALTQAAIPRSEWNAVNKTGDREAEKALNRQLRRNNLTSEGIRTVVPESESKNQGVEP